MDGPGEQWQSPTIADAAAIRPINPALIECLFVLGETIRFLVYADRNLIIC
jgi:hypothetical protein